MTHDRSLIEKVIDTTILYKSINISLVLKI